MFGNSTQTNSNLDDHDRGRLTAMLTTFSTLVRESCSPLGLGPGQVPFTRPANCLVVLNPDTIHLVVDSVAVGGVPAHTYCDRRNEVPVLPLGAIIDSAIQQLGFRAPVGVSLPLAAYIDDEARREQVLAPLAAQLSSELREHAIVQSMNLPTGYEHFARFMPAFLRDHPNVDRNVFLMMRFQSSRQYDEIYQAIRDEMARYGLITLRADDKDYTGDLWDNVCLYMLGSRFGVAVFEEIDLREFNPSVALELGFMLAQNKRCLLLKERRMPRMPTDIVGKLYKEFDSYNITQTINKCIDAWAQDLDLLPSPSVA